MFPSLEVATEDFGALHRRLHARVQLRLHEHAQLADADQAAADGDQPARGVRADVRVGEHQRSAAGAHARRPQRARRGHRGPVRSARARWGGAIARRLDEYLEHVRETERRIQQAEKQCGTRADGAGGAHRYSGIVRGPRLADVRPAGAGVRDRPDARLHVHDVPRIQRADLPEPRRHRPASHRLAHHNGPR